MQELLKKIDFYKDYYDKSFALSREQLENLKDYYRVSLTYSSNAIEGNTLTLSETQVVIEEGITVGGKTLREHNEAYGHGKAFDLMVEIAKGQGNVVTEENLLALHRLFYQKIDEEHAGKYKTEQNFIVGSEHATTSPDEVPGAVKKMVMWAEENQIKLHPVEFAAVIHNKIVDIHPFADGNGRTARLVLNLILLNKGYFIVTIPPVLRHEYISSIEKSRRQGNAAAITEFIGECELESIRDRYRLLGEKLPTIE